MRRRAAKVILCVILMGISLSVTACGYRDDYKDAKEETERSKAEEKTERHSFIYKLFARKQLDYVDDEAAGIVAEEADVFAEEADTVVGEKAVLSEETCTTARKSGVPAEETYTTARESGVPAEETYTTARKSGVPAEEIYIDSGEKDDPAGEADDTAEAVTPAEDPVSAEEPVGRTLEVYLNSVPGVRRMIESMIANEIQNGMSVTTEVKGNDFICNVTFDDISMFTDDIDAEFETLAHIFRQAAGRMDEMIGQDGAVTIIIRCLDHDGKLLAERKFKAK